MWGRSGVTAYRRLGVFLVLRGRSCVTAYRRISGPAGPERRNGIAAYRRNAVLQASTLTECSQWCSAVMHDGQVCKTAPSAARAIAEHWKRVSPDGGCRDPDSTNKRLQGSLGGLVPVTPAVGKGPVWRFFLTPLGKPNILLVLMAGVPES